MNDLLNQTEDFSDIRDAVRSLCQGYPGEYWREKDRKRQYPTEFVQAWTNSVGYWRFLSFSRQYSPGYP